MLKKIPGKLQLIWSVYRLIKEVVRGYKVAEKETGEIVKKVDKTRGMLKDARLKKDTSKLEKQLNSIIGGDISSELQD